MDTTLVIMAAGIGSRFGGGIKQLAPVGPSGEIIMDYSIHDALEAGFNKIVFIIRHDLEKDFREVIGNRIEKICDVSYAFQELENLPGGYKTPADGEPVTQFFPARELLKPPLSLLMQTTTMEKRLLSGCMITWFLKKQEKIRPTTAWPASF